MNQHKPRPIKKIQQEILNTLIILASIMTILIAVISILVNIKSESIRLDQNLQNVAQAIAQSQVIQNGFDDNHTEESYYVISPYLNSLKDSLSNIDVISVVGSDGIRKYHTNADLINTVYDGTVPTFQYGESVLSVTSDTGPSGSQRRAYAAIYDKDGNYSGLLLCSIKILIVSF
jgi:sensor histidine kinase regulating citrate/malate metabolism